MSTDAVLLEYCCCAAAVLFQYSWGYCCHINIVGQGVVLTAQHVQQKVPPQERGQDAEFCANNKMKLAPSLPLPPSPWGPRAAQPLGRLPLSPGGGGRGREGARAPGSAPPSPSPPPFPLGMKKRTEFPQQAQGNISAKKKVQGGNAIGQVVVVQYQTLVGQGVLLQYCWSTVGVMLE